MERIGNLSRRTPLRRQTGNAMNLKSSRCRWLSAGAVQRGLAARLLALALPVAGQIGGAAAEQHSAPPLTTLTNLEAALSLPLAEAQRGYRLQATVTVTYCHPQWGMLFVLGKSLGTYISISPNTPPMRPGDVVEIEGVTSASRGWPELKIEGIRPTGQRRTLTSQPLELQKIVSGTASCEWVEIEGRVLAAYGKDGRVGLRLTVGMTNLPVFLLRANLETARRWMDARVRIGGVVSVQYNAQGKMTGVTILAQEAEQLLVLQPAETNPLELPLTSISRLRTPATGKPSERVHVQGVLVQLQSDSIAWVRDRTAAIRVQCSFKPDERVDASVEVLGYPILTNGEVVLRDAVVLPLAAPMTPGSAMAPATSSPTNSLPVITTARAVHRLSPGEAARGYPVRLEGIVTYSDPGWWMFFVQDETDAVFVSPLSSQVQVPPGQRVLVDGVTAAGAFAPTVTLATFTLLGVAPLPTPLQPTLGELLTGQFDCRWVRISGVVQSVSEDDGRATLYLRTREGPVSAILTPAIPVTEGERLVDARVTLRGVVGVLLNGHGQLLGVRLHVPNLDSVHVDEPPPADPFELATVQIGDLLRYRPDEDTSRRVKIAGTITSAEPDGTISLQDASAGMMVRLESRWEIPKLGDRVEIAGYPTAVDVSATLINARLRIVGSGAEVGAADATPAEILGGAHASELVRIHARLMEDAMLGPGVRLVLQSEAVVFESILPAGLPVPKTEPLAAGSQLAVTGVCRVQSGLGNQPQSFRLLLRRPQDVTLLARPPWWNLRRLGWVLGGVGGVSVLALLWDLALAKKNRQLHESEERARTILNHVQTGIVVMDPETHSILEVNPVALAMMGRSRDEVVGRTCHQFMCPSERGRCPVTDLGQTSDNAERVLLRAHGDPLPILKTVVPVTLGARPVLLESFVDISERKCAQQALLAAKEEAESASRAKSEFLAMMSHEIRTPLSGVIGVLHLVGRDGLTPRQERHLEMASTSAETLLRVINDILDFSKVEAGKLDLEKVTFDVRHTLESIATTFQARAEAKYLALEVSMHAAVPRWVQGDPLRVGQVLMNLLGNALKFTEAGRVTVRVEAQPEAHNHSTVRCTVTDTGIGIPREQQKHLFQPFFQVDSSARRRHGGTGLGLGICRQLVELMGGRIGVDSEPGRGSTFWFELPFATSSGPFEPLDSVQTSEARTELNPPHADGRQPQARVLLAEDNEINQEVAREMIEAAGCRCECVGNGRNAASAVLAGDYDLVFMDCMMPEMDGYEAAQAIRAEETRRAAAGEVRRVPIIALTANAMKGDRERCLAAGMDDYMSKPLEPEAMARMVRRWLAKSAQKSPAVMAGEDTPRGS